MARSPLLFWAGEWNTWPISLSLSAYKVALPPYLSKIHNVFYVSTLRKYVFDASHVVELEPI